MTEDRDKRNPRPLSNVPRVIDSDATPVEGTPMAASLHWEFGQLREDFRAHAAIDAQGIGAIQLQQNAQGTAITDMKIETARQTVMLQNIEADLRDKRQAEEKRTRERRDVIMEAAKWIGAIAAALIIGWLTHKYTG